MKVSLKNVSLLALLLGATAFVSCSEKDEPEEPAYVSVYNSDGTELKSIVFDAEEGTRLVSVKSNASWTVSVPSDAKSWLSVTPSQFEGDTYVQLTAYENTALDARSATVSMLVNGESLSQFVVNQSGITPMFAVAPEADKVPTAGGQFTFNITTNAPWEYAITPAATEVSKETDKLVLDFPANSTTSEVEYSLTFTYSGNTQTLTLKQEAKAKIVADLLDVVFKSDGTAEDVSPMHNTIITSAGNTLMTYYNSIHNCYVANFRNTLGGNTTSGYYRINYTAGGDFISKIADGCTFESIMMLGETNPGTSEVKWFSSMETGGIGFILPLKTRNSSITFLPNTHPSGTSTWRWTHSNVVPEPGTYYHVVGVWNKTLGKSYIYINGELKGTADAPGNLRAVASGAESFIIGGDPTTNQTSCTASWNGEVVTVRVYDDPLTEDQVAELWDAAKFDTSAQNISISDLQYYPECEVKGGYKYSVYGTGFESGDKIVLQAVGSDTKYEATTTIGSGYATITIPSNLTSGSYRLVVKRGTAESPICVVKFNVSATPNAPVTPKIIAHRGLHTDGATENSLASLTKAMNANFYAIELDVWTTTDGELVVHHDGTANSLTFQNCTYSQIKDITLSNGEKLPTFDSFVSTFMSLMNTSTSNLVIEIKSHNSTAKNNSAVDKVMQIVEEKGIKSRVEYIAFNYDVCKRIVSKDKDAVVGYLNGDKSPNTVLADGIKSIDYNYGVLDNYPSWITEAKSSGVIINVWTVNSATNMLKYMGLGADCITTDYPETLRELCNKTFISAN